MFVKLKTERQKAANEVKQGEIDLVTKSVTSMIASQQELMSHNQELIKALTASRRENQELSDKLDELEKKINTMINANRQIVKILRKLKVDDEVIKLIDKDA
jgi:predicted RNase H-like nuclease (RuvC/YqgF family)